MRYLEYRKDSMLGIEHLRHGPIPKDADTTLENEVKQKQSQTFTRRIANLGKDYGSFPLMIGGVVETCYPLFADQYVGQVDKSSLLTMAPGAIAIIAGLALAMHNDLPPENDKPLLPASIQDQAPSQKPDSGKMLHARDIHQGPYTHSPSQKHAA